jgi:hypothetical protein
MGGVVTPRKFLLSKKPSPCNCLSGVGTVARAGKSRTPASASQTRSTTSLPPYRQAAALLEELLAETGGLNYATTRNRTLAVGKRWSSRPAGTLELCNCGSSLLLYDPEPPASPTVAEIIDLESAILTAVLGKSPDPRWSGRLCAKAFTDKLRFLMST